MTDFYTVLRNALDRVGAADSGQRERVYDHVREVMVRKLRNHRPPVAETEIANRISTFDAAIDRIEGELLEEQEARQSLRRRERRDARRYEPAPQYEDAYYDEPEPAPAEPVWEDEEPEPEPLADWEGDSAAPGPIWGAPAIDMAWDEGSAQWHDARPQRAIDPDLDEMPPETGPFEDLDAEGRRRSRGFARFSRRRHTTANGAAEPQLATPPPAEVEDDDEVENAEPAPTRRRRGILRGLRSSRQRRRGDALDDLPVSDPDEAAAPRRGRAARRRDTEPSARNPAPRGGDPIAELANRLDARGAATDRSEPLLLAPPSGRAEPRLYLPSPDQVEPSDEVPARRQRRGRRSELDDLAVEDEAPRRQRRGRRNEADDLAVEDEPPRRRMRGRRQPSIDDIAGDDEASESRGRRTKKRSRGRRRDGDEAAAKPKVRHSGLWLALIMVFALAVFAWAGYVAVQLLSGNDAEGADGVVAATDTNTPAAAATPATPLTVGETITLFEGGDPTVFEAGADNPVRYQGDTAGGIVQITSSSTSGGARAVIGPGVANLLAGHQVRFLIEARGTPGQPAQAVRIAYKRGLTTLEWRPLRVLDDFAVLTPGWTIPTGSTGTDGTDYLLIEPGVPGDGTAVDIRSIRIEILE